MIVATRICRYEKCRRPLLVTHRADAEFCDELCRSRDKNERRRQSASATRVNLPDGGVGTRGGNVRSVQEARILQSESAELDRWRLVMELKIFETLVGTGRFHVDDLDGIDAPPRAVEARGTLVNSVRARGYMRSTNVQRRVSHRAANARKAWIYQITEKGRLELPSLVAKLAGVHADVSPGGPGGGVDSGETSPGAEGSRADLNTLPVDSFGAKRPLANEPSDKAPGEDRPTLFPGESAAARHMRDDLAA